MNPVVLRKLVGILAILIGATIVYAKALTLLLPLLGFKKVPPAGLISKAAITVVYFSAVDGLIWAF
jgi:hypothetical protein